MWHHQEKTSDNTNFDDPLTAIIEFKVREKEKREYIAIAQDAGISISELMRNLAREYIHQYALDPILKKTIRVSNIIDKHLTTNRVVSTRKPSNLSKIREIFDDFESLLDDKKSNISESDLRSYIKVVVDLLKCTYEDDEWLYNKIKKQGERILKNKHVKELDS